MTEVCGESCLAVVADGLGGHPHGDQASRAGRRAPHLEAKPSTTDELTIALHRANDLIYQEMKRTAGSTGMGTTVAAALVHDGGLTVANVGDSQVFELFEGRLVQLSIDDVLRGRSDLPGVPSAWVTQTLGGKVKRTVIKPHVYEDDVPTQRQLLLCTDGLTNFVPRSQIAEALARGIPEAVVALIGLALDAGGQQRHGGSCTRPLGHLTGVVLRPHAAARSTPVR